MHIYHIKSLKTWVSCPWYFKKELLIMDIDAKIHLNVMCLKDTIKEANIVSIQDCTKVIIFFYHYLNEGLKFEYFTVKYLLILRKKFQRKIWQKKLLYFKKAHYHWNFCWQNFKFISENNFVIFHIIFKLKVFKEDVNKDMLEKIFFTFHVSNVLLTNNIRTKKNYKILTMNLIYFHNWKK